jgi:hypothetical protein
MPALALSVAISPHTAGARPVLITLETHYEMQCGWPGPGALLVRFPAGMTLPATLVARSAIVNGKPVTPREVVALHGGARTVAVALPKRPQIMCDSIGPGTLTVTFTRGARIGLPKAAGSYVVRAAHGTDQFAGRVSVTR